jgi:3-oxoacyl-(acyl-carrier-protein) synthase
MSLPFDARRDGFVLGEGAGILVLETAESAERRGAATLGEVLGYGATTDVYNVVSPHPQGRASAMATRHALADADVTVDEVDYVNAHGTAAPITDRSETMALKEVFQERAIRVPVSSLKSATGHLLGAAGAVEGIATLLALRRRVAPPTLNYEVPDEGLDLDYVPNKARPLFQGNDDQRSRAVGVSNSFGFGGHNTVLVFAA